MDRNDQQPVPDNLGGDHQGRFPWRPFLVFLLRGIIFCIAGFVAAFLYVLLADQIRLGLFRTIGSNAATVFIASALISVSVFAGILGGILATSIIEKKSATLRIRDDLSALASSHKVMLLFVAIPLLSALVSPTLFSAFSALPLFGACLVTSALGYAPRRQFLWTSLAGLSFFWMLFSSLLRGRTETESLMVAIGLLAIAAALTSLVSQLMLIRRAAQPLKVSGLKVGLLGVAFRDIAAAEECREPQPEEEHISEAPDAVRAASAGENDPAFYYLGPNNEAIGPISQQVLLQLRESGAVTDESLIVPEDESNWRPLRDVLEIDVNPKSEVPKQAQSHV